MFVKTFCMWEMKKISFCNMALFWIFVMKILGWKHFKERNYWQNYFTYWSMWGSMRSTKPWYLYLRFKIRQIRAWEKNFEIRSAKLGWGFEKCFRKFVVDIALQASMILRHPLQNRICKNKLTISIKLNFFHLLVVLLIN